jgi:AcrR family transcriptional regulator
MARTPTRPSTAKSEATREEKREAKREEKRDRKNAPKQSRSYDATSRTESARITRERIVDVARAELLAHGYGAVTIAAIADGAGVSAETIYKGFGGKPGLVRAVYETALLGRGERSAPARSDAMSDAEKDPHVIVKEWGKLASEVAPLVSPVLLLVKAAAVGEPALDKILDDDAQQRWSRMRHNVAKLDRLHALKRSVSVDYAADVAWALLAPELYEALVVRRGWSAQKYGAFVGATMDAALLKRKR